jgi:flagellar biosynthesis protein FlhA
MANNSKTDTASIPFGSYSNYVLAFGLVAVLATLIIPLPTPILDMLLACSISLAIAVLIVTLSSREALDKIDSFAG